MLPIRKKLVRLHLLNLWMLANVFLRPRKLKIGNSFEDIKSRVRTMSQPFYFSSNPNWDENFQRCWSVDVAGSALQKSCSEKSYKIYRERSAARSNFLKYFTL